MEDFIHSLGDAAVINTLDAIYCRIEMDDAGKNNTTFTYHCGLFRFLRMPFGLKNAAAMSQQAFDIIL